MVRLTPAMVTYRGTETRCNGAWCVRWAVPCEAIKTWWVPHEPSWVVGAHRPGGPPSDYAGEYVTEGGFEEGRLLTCLKMAHLHGAADQGNGHLPGQADSLAHVVSVQSWVFEKCTSEVTSCGPPSHVTWTATT
jgi:hypothetical protein